MQTVLTLSQLIQWKLNGFIQLDLFPEELEQAQREQDYAVWSDLSPLSRRKRHVVR